MKPTRSSKEAPQKTASSIINAIGPGFITGAADDDPSGIATYAQTGVQFGYGQLWTALFTFPFMLAIQEMCGRIGLVTGDGLSGVIRKHYSKTVLFFIVGLLLIVNTVNIGADLGAMASATELITGIPFTYWIVGFAVGTLGLEIFVSYPHYAKFLKYLTLSLFAYIITALIVTQNWYDVLLATVVPSLTFSKDYLFNITAVLGTTISPYLFFWQADEEVEEEIEARKIKAIGTGKPKVSSVDIWRMRLDTFSGMFFSNLVMLFVIITSAATLRGHGAIQIDTAAQAAEALRPLAGPFASWLFAIGIIGTGLLAIPILAGSAAGAFAEAASWKSGLSLKLQQARGFYTVIALSTLFGLGLNFLHIPPFKLLYDTAVLSGLISPPLLILILFISNNTKIMGKHTNSFTSNALGWTITAVMMGISLLLLGIVIHG